jgi:hypothetical protein|tara:strand:- start:1779 stop:4295 length:2517 start_codon:yes stop_codon:yes gene_type:complete
MRESITKLDLNFTNAGGGHSASVTSIVDAKNIDSSEGLGIVIGNLGEINSFSNDELQSLMNNYVCTEITTNADPTKKTISRKYIDKVSLILESIIVLVRGVNCPPDNTLNFNGPFAPFAEVINSPRIKGLEPFPSVGPQREGSIIKAGKIYNFETAAKFDGTKISLYYNNRTVKDELCLNLGSVTTQYRANPDLSQYNFRGGYTLKEFGDIVRLAGIPIIGLPQTEATNSIIFEATGTLASVIGTVASYLGYYWYIDPSTYSIRFINSQEASTLKIRDYTNSSSKNIISASFTKSQRSNLIVNTYVGTTEKPQDNSDRSNENDDRPKPVFFKRIPFRKTDVFKEMLGYPEMGIFFGIFNQNESTDVFDKFTYILMHGNVKPKNGEAPNEKRLGRILDFKKLYDYSPFNTQTWHWSGAGDNKPFLYGEANAKKTNEDNPTELPKLDRITDKFVYKLLKYKPTNDEGKQTARAKIMPRPSGSPLYEYLNTYFPLAGGVYITNAYSDYKTARMSFQNTGNMTVLGPFRGDKKVREIDDLSMLNDWLQLLTKSKEDKDNPNPQTEVTIMDLAESTNGDAKISRSKEKAHFFIGIRNIPSLEKKNAGKDGDEEDQPLNYAPLQENLEFFEPSNRKRQFFIGGATEDVGKVFEGVYDLAEKSFKKYKKAIVGKKSIKLKYIRSKTRVNDKDEDGEEAEDNAVAESNDAQQQLNELFDKVEFKSYKVDSPPYDRTNKLTLSSASGSTIEMEKLKQIKGSLVNPNIRPASSSRTLYGLHIPRFTPTINSLSISVGSGGITTTIGESTLSLIPPDQTFSIDSFGNTNARKGNIPSTFNASQRNFFKL